AQVDPSATARARPAVAVSGKRSPHAHSGLTVERGAGGRLAGDSIDPGKHGCGDGLIVAHVRELVRRATQSARGHADPQPLHGGNREMTVEVVAVRGIY